ncbi:HNH endonuclease [Mycetocola reblochoni]|uniref:HNH endonuclease n=1 Tax=Mycetocola reblochoni TaxID=331618 RepID=A0A3L6ZSU3_9MICO|nr:HNH endonuclease signature motif containing protein [Mycetocola reblochoni]RLP70879.1 HNH endonuclease [Mycetocola reblochoni]
MATSRTGTTRWKNITTRRRHTDRHLTTCPECNTTLNWEQGQQPNSAEVDHIIPHAQGGQDTYGNTRIICRRCNQSLGAKQSRTPRPRRNTRTVRPENTSEW